MCGPGFPPPSTASRQCRHTGQEGTHRMETHHIHTHYQCSTPRSVWVVIEGRGYRLGEHRLPEQTFSYDWVLVEAESEGKALEQAEAYLRSRQD